MARRMVIRDSAPHEHVLLQGGNVLSSFHPDGQCPSHEADGRIRRGDRWIQPWSTQTFEMVILGLDDVANVFDDGGPAEFSFEVVVMFSPQREFMEMFKSESDAKWTAR